MTEISIMRIFTKRWLDTHYPESRAHTRIRKAVEKYASEIMRLLGDGEEKTPPMEQIKEICKDAGLGLDDRKDKIIIYV